MTSIHGLTPDEALAQVMILSRIEDEAERRSEIRKVLDKVRGLGYHDGYAEGFGDGSR
jgi:hypothetical protein